MAINKKDVQALNTVTLDNNIYRVLLEDITGNSGVGTYNMRTSINHPAGPGHTLLLFGFHTIRSYSSLTDYVQTTYTGYTTDPGFTVVSLEPVSSTVPLSPTSVNTAYTLTSPANRDNMTILQNIALHGNTINDSRVAIATSITNTGLAPLSIGLRYFWDLALDDFDDGPTFQALNPDGPVLTTEATFTNPNFEAYQLQNNQGSIPMSIKGAVNGPAALNPSPVPPDKLQYAYYGSSASTSFNYTTTGQSTDSDSALLTFWGDNTGDIVLLPGQTTTMRTLLFNNVQQESRGLNFSPIL